MADGGTHPPEISVSRTSSSSSKVKPEQNEAQTENKPTPKINTWNAHPWSRGTHTQSWDKRMQNSEMEWHIPWTRTCFPNGRVLIIDYISNSAELPSAGAGKKHVAVAAVEFQDLPALEKFYADTTRVHHAALRVVHVANAPWATGFLLRKFNIDHDSEMVGMQGFNKWARYNGPRQRNGKPFPNGRSWREQTDPWRNVSRTAFGLDYLKAFPTPPPIKQKQQKTFIEKAHAMHLNSYEDDTRAPHGWDVSVQRMNVYVQRNLGPVRRLSPEDQVKNPYQKHGPNGHWMKGDEAKINLEDLDNSSAIIIFETSASLLLNDCLIQPRNEFEKRWRRLSFYLRREDVTNDDRLAAQCTNMILGDVFHGLAVIWQEFLGSASDHVNILEDKIYENPADESRASELWRNQAAWLKVDKVMYIHQDIVREMQGHLRDMSNVEVDNYDDDSEAPQSQLQLEWLNSTPAEYDRLNHSVQEDLVQPTTNLSDLMYKSVGIRDSRQSLQLGLSMWRLSWITFIFLPLTFIVSFFGMNVNIFGGDGGGGLPNVGWYFLAAGILMIFVLLLWYCVKHSLQRRRQTPYQRGVFEGLFVYLEGTYPELWNRDDGALDDFEPAGFTNRLKWRLIKRWFAPEKTIKNETYQTLGPEGDDSALGSWMQIKFILLERWLPQLQRRYKEDAEQGIAMQGVTPLGQSSSEPALVLHESGAVTEVAKFSTPIAIATAEPNALQQVSTIGLQPVNMQDSQRRRRSSSLGHQERPGSRGSSGIMFEERNFSDSESDVGDGAVRASRDQGRSQSSTAPNFGGLL